jgi:hypothetical protein
MMGVDHAHGEKLFDNSSSLMCFDVLFVCNRLEIVRPN